MKRKRLYFETLLLLLLLLLLLFCFAGCEHFGVEIDYHGHHGHHIYNHAPPPPWPIGHGR